jgi:hypothetical protein
MNLDSIAEYLEQRPTLTLVRGTNLFIESMPANVLEGVMLRDDHAGTPLDSELPGYIRGNFMVVARSADRARARTLAQAISDLLNMWEASMTGMDILHIKPRIQPLGFPNTAGAMWEFFVTFDACYVEV